MINKNAKMITARDYQELGAVEGALEAYIDDGISGSVLASGHTCSVDEVEAGDKCFQS